jgi:hypothetical protein
VGATNFVIIIFAVVFDAIITNNADKTQTLPA